MDTTRYPRRTVLRTAAAAGAVGLAGCLGREPPDMPPDTPAADRPPLLSPDERDALLAAFDDDPFAGETPGYVWKWVTPETLVFLRFDAADVTRATAVDYLGVGLAGTFCEGSVADPAATRFLRFDAPQPAGGAPGDEGVWLIHLAARSLAEAEPGVVALDPTPAGMCPRMAPAPRAGAPLTPEARDRLLATFTDMPFTGGQDAFTAKHVFKTLSPDTFAFLHFDHPDVTRATGLEYVGLGVRGTFYEEDRPAPEFTHFHSRSAATWEAGHGGTAGADGYWLVHVAVTELTQPWGRVVPGVDRAFFPTPAPSRRDPDPFYGVADPRLIG